MFLLPDKAIKLYDPVTYHGAYSSTVALATVSLLYEAPLTLP